MVSGFMCECHGFITRNGVSTFKIIEPGKNKKDGYWTNANLVDQLKDVMPLFEDEPDHADCELVFQFDNSQNHHAREPTALTVSDMILSDGGKNASVIKRDGYWVDADGFKLW